MKPQKICIIGNGLTGLTTATILAKANIDIDLYCGIKKKSNNLDKRTTAISESNFQYLKNRLNFKNNGIFWPCKQTNLFFEDKKKIINFLNFNETYKNSMYIFKNESLKKILNKIILTKKNIKLVKKNIKSINIDDSYVISEKKKKFYDLIILSIGSVSKFYSMITSDRSIKKNYKEIAVTGIVEHKSQIKNASQFFLKEGPLAILPFYKNKFSTVWSVNINFFRSNEKNFKNVLMEKLQTILKNKKIINIKHLQSFPINLDLKTKYFKKNIIILGDGLHAVHPMAGQGFNLVLRDIKKFSELTSKTLKLGIKFKDSFLLKNFYDARKPENNMFGLGINLTNIFFKNNKYFSIFKKTIIKNVSNFNFIKKTSQSIADKGISF